MIVVLDTCALLWLTLDPSQISLKTQKVISQADSICISSVSIWEVGVKWKARKLELGTSYGDYVNRVTACKDFEVVSVDAHQWAKSIELDWLHRDPADRLIITLALERDGALVTGDKQLHKFYHRCIS